MEYSDIVPDFRLAQNLTAASPLVEALARRSLRVGDVLDADVFDFYGDNQSPDESDQGDSDNDSWNRLV